MKPNRSIQKVFAFLLILTLSQAAGINFFLHTKLHVAKATTQTTSSSVQYNCSCTDDFNMPFEKATEQKQIQSVKEFAVIELAPVDDLQLHQRFTTLLRGPPAVI